MRWVFVKVLSGGGVMASPLEIGKGAPLELEGGGLGCVGNLSGGGLLPVVEKFSELSYGV